MTTYDKLYHAINAALAEFNLQIESGDDAANKWYPIIDDLAVIFNNMDDPS